jgi:hypothetical protein
MTDVKGALTRDNCADGGTRGNPIVESPLAIGLYQVVNGIIGLDVRTELMV